MIVSFGGLFLFNWGREQGSGEVGKYRISKGRKNFNIDEFVKSRHSDGDRGTESVEFAGFRVKPGILCKTVLQRSRIKNRHSGSYNISSGRIKRILTRKTMIIVKVSFKAKISLAIFLFIALFFSIGEASSPTGSIDPERKVQIQKDYGRIPLYFMENKGQVDEQVKFYEKSQGHNKGRSVATAAQSLPSPYLPAALRGS